MFNPIWKYATLERPPVTAVTRVTMTDAHAHAARKNQTPTTLFFCSSARRDIIKNTTLHAPSHSTFVRTPFTFILFITSTALFQSEEATIHRVELHTHKSITYIPFHSIIVLNQDANRRAPFTRPSKGKSTRHFFLDATERNVL
jgi:hypothetical protein